MGKSAVIVVADTSSTSSASTSTDHSPTHGTAQIVSRRSASPRAMAVGLSRTARAAKSITRPSGCEKCSTSSHVLYVSLSDSTSIKRRQKWQKRTWKGVIPTQRPSVSVGVWSCITDSPDSPPLFRPSGVPLQSVMSGMVTAEWVKFACGCCGKGCWPAVCARRRVLRTSPDLTGGCWACRV